MPPDFSRIPDAMKTYRQWIVWRYEETDGDKPTKVPYSPHTARPASVNEPSDWGTFAECVHIATAYPHSCSGIGFVLTEHDPFAFIDLDAPKRKPTHTDAEFATEAAKVMERQRYVFQEFDSYAEMSPSGNGLHIIVNGALPHGRKRGSIEVYSSQRYMTMTGNVYRDAPIRDYNELLNTLWEQMGPPPNLQSHAMGLDPEKDTDARVIEIATNAKNGEKFQDLYFAGNWQKYYPSQSEADFALVDIIAHYTNNRTQVQRIFLTSKLAEREKSRAQYRINYMLNRCFDNRLPLVDIEGLQNQIRGVLERQAALRAKAIADSVPPDSVLQPMHIADESPYQVPPGLVGMVARWIYEQSPRPVPEIALVGALGLVAGIVGRAYNVSGTGLNQYVLLLASTGAGKEAISSGVSRLMGEVIKKCPPAETFVGPSDMASGQGLIKALNKKPCFVSVVGEIGLKLRQMTGDHAPQHLLQLRKVMLDLYNKSGNGNVLQPTAYSDTDKNVAAIMAPSFTMVGESTPERFYEALSEDMISEGFLPRFTVIEYHGMRVDLNKGAETRRPAPDLVDAMANLCAGAISLNTNNRVCPVRLSGDAESVADQFDRFCTDEINKNRSEVIKGLWNRAHIKVLKLAGLIAVGCNFYDPIIDLNCINWAKRIVLSEVNNMLARFEAGDVGSATDHETVKQVAKAVEVIRDYIVKPWPAIETYRVANAYMHAERIVPYSYLFKRLAQVAAFSKSRVGSANAIKNTIQLLITRGDVLEVPRGDLQRKFMFTGAAYMIANPQAFEFDKPAPG
jgi:hypothetical protein